MDTPGQVGKAPPTWPGYEGIVGCGAMTHSSLSSPVPAAL